MADDPTQQPSEPDSPRIWEVTISTAGTASPSPVRVSKQRGDRVKWIAAPGGGPWTITFDKGDCTPFNEAVLDVPANGVVVSSKVHGTAVAPKKYKYRVRDGNSPFNETQDPDVDVE